jgi:DNA-binding transcriptional regulator YhcF (GntR family)
MKREIYKRKKKNVKFKNLEEKNYKEKIDEFYKRMEETHMKNNTMPDILKDIKDWKEYSKLMKILKKQNRNE